MMEGPDSEYQVEMEALKNCIALPYTTFLSEGFLLKIMRNVSPVVHQSAATAEPVQFHESSRFTHDDKL
jgi:hypothetical protein